MSRNLEHLLNTTAAEPSRPADPPEIHRLARRRRRLRRAGTTIAGVAVTAGLVTAIALPLSGGTDDTVTEPAADPAPADVAPPVTTSESDCPVTEPPTPGFEPPEGYPAEPSQQADAGPPGSKITCLVRHSGSVDRAAGPR